MCGGEGILHLVYVLVGMGWGGCREAWEVRGSKY